MIELILTIEPPLVFAICSAALSAKENAGLIDRDHPVPALQPVGVANRATGDPGVVHQDIEPATIGHSLGDEGHPFGLAGDVNRCRDGIASFSADVSSDRFSLIP
jgi:hypothetical protein